MVFKGTAVAQGTGRAMVTATGMQTEMGGIATLLDTTPDAPTPLQGDRLSGQGAGHCGAG
jgi:Ca2+-transporting ATPase